MQPEQPNPWLIVAMIFAKMISTAGAKEAELQGASSVVRGNAVVEAMQRETLKDAVARQSVAQN
jgi:hypothetical protein